MTDPEPSITLNPGAAEQHNPESHTLPEYAGPSLTCSCGTAMYAATANELPALWRAHLLHALGLQPAQQVLPHAREDLNPNERVEKWLASWPRSIARTD